MRSAALIAALLLIAAPSAAQGIVEELGQGGSLSGTAIQMFLLVTVLSLAPGIAIMVTCFPFIVTVLAILRQAIGLQQSPPNMLLVSLAIFLTYFVMDPVFREAWELGAAPFMAEQIALEEAMAKAYAPFQTFMSGRVDPETLAALLDLRNEPAGTEPPPSILIPAFMLSEISRAFQIGFLIFLPFLIIDLVVAAVLMSMGMMMVPPAIVSLPFKLSFFVLADGWRLISEGLVRGYF
ncbi:MAG: flagellar type III secretion system pore protein FliP [Paracoccaceae bacterium]|jgi:flagellar biosynthetic protein FliP|nr:flagellar type III secretion system pore protein FliP [Paracoccaceae bacterium]MDP7186215.1 flagellar type III secretion system pore protein FliP [Paracoccaceae bacterium]